MRAAWLIAGMICCFGMAVQGQTWREWSAKADAAMDQKNFAQAVEGYDQALKLQPKNAELLLNRGKCLATLGRWDAALRDFDKGIERQLIDDGYWETPVLAAYYFEKAFALDRMTRHAEAIPLYEKVIALEKNFPYAHNNLAWILASSYDPKLRNPDRAIELVKVELARTDWKDPASLDTLAGAYAAKGMFDEAVETMLKAMAQDLTDLDKKEFEDHLELFRKKQPFVQTKKDWGEGKTETLKR